VDHGIFETHIYTHTLRAWSRLDCKNEGGNLGGGSCSDRKPLLDFTSFTGIFSKDSFSKELGGGNLCKQLLCKLPLTALEFTDVGGHRNAPDPGTLT